MEGYVWGIIIAVLLLIVLPIVGIILLFTGIVNMAKKDGFCYRTDSTLGGEVCSIMTKDECDKHKGKHFDTMDECDDYMNNPNSKESYGCGCCN